MFVRGFSEVSGIPAFSFCSAAASGARKYGEMPDYKGALLQNALFVSGVE
jgi:hypothetical protein